MRQWPNDATVAHLIFLDHLDVPTSQTIDDAVEHARRKGARAIRTSALFPRAADGVLAAGFEPIDRLALFRHRIDGDALDALPDAHSTLPFRPWHTPAAADIDQDAFGPTWGNDVPGLRDIRRATPHHRGRIVRRGQRLAGFAISGAAGDTGYLQRLAVAPAHQRAGIARSLVIDALRWMQHREATVAMVNTGVTNSAGLALYDSLGFERLDDELIIAERRLTG